ncbi:ArnT family glycosyltransferase [Planctomycetota bacterium]
MTDSGPATAASSCPERPAGNTGRWKALLRNWWPWGILILIVVLHFIYLMHYFAPAIASPDANGYWAQGSRFLMTGQTGFKLETDIQYTGTHWLVTKDEKFFSRYPPGLAIMIGLLYRAFGHEAGVLANPLLASLSLIGLFLVLRIYFQAWWALAGTAILAVNPLFNQQALQGFAHMAVTCFLLWGLFLLLRWSEDRKLWQAIGAGLILGCIPAIRYPGVLFGIGIGVFLLWDFRSKERPWKSWLAAAGAAGLPVILLLIRNQMAFGAFYRTGYSLTNEQTGFGWGYFGDHFFSYIHALHANAGGLFFALGILGITMMCCIKEQRRLGSLLALLIIPLTLLYMAYYWGGRAGAGMRFMLPTLPCYIFGGIWMLRRLTWNKPIAVTGVLIAVALLVQTGWGWTTERDNFNSLAHRKQVLTILTDALQTEIQPGDVVISDRSILEHLDYVFKWKLIESRSLQGNPRRRTRPGMKMEEDPGQPSPRQQAKETVKEKAYEGLMAWERELVIADQVREWAGDGHSYFVGAEADLNAMRGTLFSRDSFSVIARLPVPKAPEQTDRIRGAQKGMPGRIPPDGMPDMMRRGRRGGGGMMGSPVFTSDEIIIARWQFRLPPGRSASPDQARIAGRAKKLHALIEKLLGEGKSPNFFWPPERERELQRLMSAGRFKEANDLLNRAHEECLRKGMGGRR